MSANTLLVFYFLFRTTHARWPSALVAALFALHPLHVESVAWASERKDTLSTFFGLLSLIAYVRYAEAPFDQPIRMGRRHACTWTTRQADAGNVAVRNVAARLLAVAQISASESQSVNGRSLNRRELGKSCGSSCRENCRCLLSCRRLPL